ncbi:hypothetical membrane protein [Sulfolobus acidocaldarius DSM 639]|uniref:Hypothetical membrane protein n=1 Tax=Sulfolobus acidocaldarius (strain ATCC 33909 / DSM 639 / JCM 8929 / NBRC 15157 / NCIMB 11770) TaxID=330779 RepID=Q4J6Y0_SULAC|nr:hypothetical membrane protein [Sulfolobus acidocaldarius DSM 639]
MNLAQSNREIVELLVPIIVGYMSLFISSIFVYRIGKIILRRDSISLISAIIFLLNPSTIFCLLYSPKNYGFASVGYYFVPLLYLMSYYYYLKKDWKKFTAFTVALTLTSPLSYLIAITFIVYLLIRNRIDEKSLSWSLLRENKISLVLILVSLIIGVLVIPQTLQHFSSLLIASIYPQYTSLNYIYDNVYFKLTYWFILFGVFSFLPIFSPLELIPALPYLLVGLFSSYIPYYSYGYYPYYFLALPMLIMGFIRTINLIKDDKRTMLISYVFIFLFNVALLYVILE